MQDLRISLVQGATRRHDPAGNRDYYGDLIAPLHGHTDLVLLPETFTSGFSNDALDQAETTDAPPPPRIREHPPPQEFPGHPPCRTSASRSYRAPPAGTTPPATATTTAT